MELSSRRDYRSAQSVSERGPHFEKPEGISLRLFSELRPFPFATETHLTAFGDDRPTAYATVILVPSYALAISADLPSFGDDCPATNTIFHRSVGGFGVFE